MQCQIKCKDILGLYIIKTNIKCKMFTLLIEYDFFVDNVHIKHFQILIKVYNIRY